MIKTGALFGLFKYSVILWLALLESTPNVLIRSDPSHLLNSACQFLTKELGVKIRVLWREKKYYHSTQFWSSFFLKGAQTSSHVQGMENLIPGQTFQEDKKTRSADLQQEEVTYMSPQNNLAMTSPSRLNT